MNIHRLLALIQSKPIIKVMILFKTSFWDNIEQNDLKTNRM